MTTINKLKNQHKRADLARIYKELTRSLELNITEDHLKNKIDVLLVSGETIDKSNRDRQSFLLNGNTSPTATKTDPAFDHVYDPELQETLVRSSRPEVFCKKGVFRNFTKFTGKHLYQSLFFNKVAGLRYLLLQ